MSESPKTHSRAPGFPIALSVIGGSIVGTIMGQPSIGFLAGFGLGMGIAIAMWLADRKKG